MAEEKISQTEIVKIDEIYDGDLSFEEIKKHPILQPIAEFSHLYETLGLMIKKEVAEFTSVQEQINKLLASNPVYSKTQIVGYILELKSKTANIIFSNDMMNSNLKQVIKEMVKLDKKYNQEDKVEKKEAFPLKDLEVISRGRPKKVDKEIEKKEEQKQEQKEEIVWDGDIKEEAPVINL